jgi:hypothetical protein
MQDMYDRKRRMFACWLSSGRNGLPANQASISSSKLSVPGGIDAASGLRLVETSSCLN